MNTMPDETTLARWLEDDLQGAQLAAFEATIQGNAELLARRAEVRLWRAGVAAVMPAVSEPPYPEFFNSRIQKAIRELTPKLSPAPPKAVFWRAWWMPATAVAGMVLAFWAGIKTGGVTQVVTHANVNPVPLLAQAPVVYTPERGVDAEWFSSTKASATVIVLEGVEAIPDTLDFSGTVGLRRNRDSTAGLENPESGEVAQ
jgi:hypothetical protein